MSKFGKEFKEFILRGNVVDMAVGVIIGGAFGKIVSSLVEDVIMPPITLLTSQANFTDLKIVLRKAIMAGEEVVQPEVAMTIGNFIQVVVDFLIIAAVIFLMIKGINRLRSHETPAKEEQEVPAEPSEEVKLLQEIRDSLKKE